jgi:hypothetical protein
MRNTHPESIETACTRCFTRLDRDLHIDNSSMKAVRRLIQSWPDLDREKKQLAMTRLLQMLRHRALKAELLPRLMKVAAEHRLEMEDVCDLETGEGCLDEPRSKPKPASKGPSLLSQITNIALGAVAATTAIKALRRVKEDASAGATAASSVATVSGAIGAGFDPKGHRGIYEPKVIKRVMEATNDRPTAEEIDYYTSEGCGIFAYALWIAYGRPMRGEIGIFSRKNGDG